MHLAMDRLTQVANRGALNDHPSPARILDFSTIVNNLKFFTFVDLSL